MSQAVLKNSNSKIDDGDDDKAEGSFTSSSATSAPCSTIWLLASLFWNDSWEFLLRNKLQHL